VQLLLQLHLLLGLVEDHHIHLLSSVGEVPDGEGDGDVQSILLLRGGVDAASRHGVMGLVCGIHVVQEADGVIHEGGEGFAKDLLLGVLKHILCGAVVGEDGTVCGVYGDDGVDGCLHCAIIDLLRTLPKASEGGVGEGVVRGC
jgi:hypothetical protein